MKSHSYALGKYEYLSTLQITRNIVVALCRDPGTALICACKTTSSARPTGEMIASLNREYELTLKAQAPDVVELLGRETSESGAPILVFRFYPGGCLKAGENPLPLQECLALFIRIVKALGTIHARRIIHRDINPSNIIWDPATHDIRIIDFSLASDIFSETVKADAAETIQGTLPFISPEQTGRVNRKVDFRSDFYSLGMTFFQFLTGQLPFSAKDAIGWVYCHITEQPILASELNPSIPKELALVVHKMLSKNPEDRYQSSFGMIQDLQKISDGLLHNSMDRFVPGATDVCEWLQIPEKLYGRGEQVSSFLSFFEQVKRGRKLLCTIAGPSGMGKSVLVNEVQKPVVGSHGNFISGKCDQYKRNIPYSAIRFAFSDLIKQQLAKSVEEVEVLKRQILGTLGENAKVISEVIPELEALTGPQNAVPRLEPKESRARFQRTFAQLLRLFTVGGQPLVAFLDDLQWSDLPSLDLIKYLMIEADLKAVMIVAVFRDNEVQAGHPLLAVLDEVRKAFDIPSISLSPLNEEAIAELLGDTLQHSPEETIEFAKIILNKSAGNPFHVTEMIKTLHEGNAVFFDNTQGKWKWDLEKITQMSVPSDIVELMVSTLQKCPNSAQDRLKIAACVGAQFELNTLALVCGCTPMKVIEDLWATIEKGLIIPLGETYKLLKSGLGIDNRLFHFKFQHDRVHEAAYIMIPPADRPRTHLDIGRILLKKSEQSELDTQIIEIVRHFNLGAELITDPQERIELVQMNVVAAEKARNTVAYDSCLSLLKLAKGSLPDDCWQKHFLLTKRILFAISEAASFLDDKPLVLETNETLLKRLTDPLDRGELELMRMEQKYRAGDFAAACKIGQDSLRSLGIRLPKHPSKIRFLLALKSLQRTLRSSDLGELALRPGIADRRMQIALTQLMAMATVFVTQGNRIMAGFVIIQMVRLSLAHGNAAETGYGMMATASLLSNTLLQYDLGNRLAKVALEIDARYGSTKIRTSIYHIYALFISAQDNEQEKVPGFFNMAIEAGLMTGEQHNMPFAAALVLTVDPQITLQDALIKAETHLMPIIKASHNEVIYKLGDVYQRERKILSTPLGEAERSKFLKLDQECEQIFKDARFLSGHFCLFLSNAMTHYLLNDEAGSYQAIRRCEDYLLAGRNSFHESEFHLFNVLISARFARNLNPAERRRIEKSMRASLKRIKGLAWHIPQNFRQRYLLMQAEYLQSHGRKQEAARCYAEALDSVRPVFARDTAMIHEAAARFHLAIGHRKLAEMFIVESCHAFQRWGAHNKVKLLIDEWPLLETLLIEEQSLKETTHPHSASIHGTSQREGGHSLDVMTITRAAQSLSSQVEMAGLIKQLMNIILENAGANYGVLILKDKDHNHIRVVAKASGEETTLVDSLALTEFAELSLSVMLYTSRVNETVIIDDAERDDRFRNDPYLQTVRPKSILAMPITLRGHTIGFFYLESRLLNSAFTQSRIQVLNILGTQAAISLENAQFYADLERKVAERTAQLAERSRDIRSILTNIKQGILTITGDLTIDPEYSRYLEQIFGTKDIAYQDFMKLCFHGSNLQSDELDLIKTALGFSIQQNSLGFVMNQNAFVREFSRQLANGERQHIELDWEPIQGSHEITEKIMVTIRDVTELKNLQEQSERNRTELNILNHLLNTGSDRFIKFSKNTEDLLHKTDGIMKDLVPGQSEAINIAYRYLHTVKGNARLLGLTDLTSYVHNCESAVELLRTHCVEFDRGRQTVLAGIQEILQKLAEYSETFYSRLMAFHGTSYNQREGRLIRILERKRVDWQTRIPEAERELATILNDLDRRTFSELIEPLTQNLAQMAKELGKEAPLLSIEGGELLLDNALETILTNAFIHLFSNAVNHGLERPEVRIHAGKEPQGRISIKVVERVDSLEFQMVDDGCGLNLPKIKAKAIKVGLIQEQDRLSESDIAQLIFRSGFSTTEEVSQSAGRGVGMDAVLDMIHDASGRLELILDPQMPFDRKTFRILFVLPKQVARAHDSAA